MGDLADVDPTADRLAVVRRERDSHRARADRLAHEVDGLHRLVDSLTNLNAKPPRWTAPKKKAKGHRAIACSVLSDMHFDEVVRPEELDGLNAYNREIAAARLRRYFDRLVEYPDRYLAGVNIDGFVLCLGGDGFSGNLHDLAETNEDTPFGSLLYWLELLAAGVGMLADRYGTVYVPCVVGNHGRLTHKPRTKLRARDNTDWLLANLLAKQFASDERVTFEVPESTDVLFNVYDVRFLLTHGDQVKGGGGIGGIWPPIMRMLARKQSRYPEGFDVAVMGHWHQLISAPSQGLICNGSLKSYDEFAAVSNFRPEPAQQAFWLVTPERGVTVTAPIFAADRKAEGW